MKEIQYKFWRFSVIEIFYQNVKTLRVRKRRHQKKDTVNRGISGKVRTGLPASVHVRKTVGDSLQAGSVPWQQENKRGTPREGQLFEGKLQKWNSPDRL